MSSKQFKDDLTFGIYDVIKQYGFADKPDNWIIVESDEILTDFTGEVIRFFSFEEVLEYLEEVLEVPKSVIEKVLVM